MKNKRLRVATYIIMMAVLSFLICFAIHVILTNEAHMGTTVEVPDSTDESEPAKEPDTPKESDDGQIYETIYDFPYDDMRFSDDEVYEILKNAFGDVDYYGEFKKGSIDEDDFYLEKFNQLIKNEATFFDPETGEEFYLNEFEDMTGYMEADETNVGHVNHRTFYYFDIDEDGAPEFCISSSYIFKYDAGLDKCILWGGHRGNYYYSIRGSRKMTWDHPSGFGDQYAFRQLDENGRIEYAIFFFQHYKPHQETNELEIVYVVELPLNIDRGQRLEVTKEIKRKAYSCCAGDERVYYFRVTEEQYNELTNDYFKASELAEEKIKEVTFTYDELFGDFVS